MSIPDMLNRRYYTTTDPISFSGINKIRKATNLPHQRIQDWLEKQDAYTLHKQIRRKFKRNRYLVTNINDLFQADLIDMRKLASYNDGVKYLLTVIDVFSKFAYVIPLYSKSGSDVAAAFEEIFTEQIPGNVQTDKGKEFLAKNVQKLFKKNDINFYVAKNPDVKAAVIERFNRTLKSKMYKYFTHANTFKYIDVLQNFVVSYSLYESRSTQQ